jgi:copper resistance protein C
MRKSVLIIAALLWPAAGFAHVFPVRADPRVGSTVTHAASVSILFDGSIEPVLSSIRVEDKAKVRVDKQDSHLDASDAHQLEVTLAPSLPAGKYQVLWTAIANDGHTTTGHYAFWIQAKKP